MTENSDMKRVAHYINKIQQLDKIKRMDGSSYLKDFIDGQDLINDLLLEANKSESIAKSNLDQAESIAYLDRANDYLQAKGIKDTADARKRYVNIDEDVKKAVDEKAKAEAMVTFLKGKLSVLKQAHDDLKKILYTDQNLTPFGGV